jgi:hypothetical protein
VDALVELPPFASVVRTGGFRRIRGAKPGGAIQAWGLFPASDLQAAVLLAASGSPLGWGTCTLSVRELAALWDVPMSWILCRMWPALESLGFFAHQPRGRCSLRGLTLF